MALRTGRVIRLICLVPALAGAGLLLPSPPAEAQAMDPLAVVRAYEAAWNSRDAGALTDLFTGDARVIVLTLGGGYLFANQATSWSSAQPGYLNLAALRVAPGRRVYLWWCPAQRACRVAGDDYRVAADTVTWRHLLFSDSLPPSLDPWEATAHAVVHGGKITAFSLESLPDWAARLRLVEDAQTRSATAQWAQAARALAAQHSAPAAPAAGETTARTEQGVPSAAVWAGAALATLLVAGLAMLKRPQPKE
jgi:hypothetical protein